MREDSVIRIEFGNDGESFVLVFAEDDIRIANLPEVIRRAACRVIIEGDLMETVHALQKEGCAISLSEDALAILALTGPS